MHVPEATSTALWRPLEEVLRLPIRCTGRIRRSAMVRALLLCAAAALGTAACRESSTAPAQPRVTLASVGDAVVHAPAQTVVPDPLRVVVLDAEKRTPVKGVAVEWRVIEGTATLSTAATVTDEFGVAEVRVTTQAGAARVRATAPRLQGPPAVFTLTVVPRPVIDGVSPASLAPGAEVRLTGRNFSTSAQQNSVLFDGVRGTILAATATELHVRVPDCLPRRTVQVRAAIGYAASASVAVWSSGSETGRLSLTPGQSHTVTEPAQLSCLQLSADPGARYLLVTHNTADALLPPLHLELRVLGTHPDVVTAARDGAAGVSFADEWEARLRRRERSLRGSRFDLPQVSAPAADPVIGDRREFNVLNASNTFDRVTATVQAVSAHAVLYVDNAAAGAFSESELQYFTSLFEDPIHPTSISVFGAPSDIDNNGRVLILFTPRVNELTPRGSSSFITGFFYGCDLVSRSRCSGTNQAEVFYSMVPDGAARWGDRRANSVVLAAVPPVLAHEFQHMIHFARRGFSSDVLWLSEALAHMAEQLMAEVFDERQDPIRADLFRAVTRSNARQYLQHYRTTSLVTEDSPGTTALRGGAWLLLMHMRGHYGGNDLLRRLTSSTSTGVANVVAQTGRPWTQLVADFGVALWVHDALDGGSLAPTHRFVGYSPRGDLTPVTGIYPIQPDNMAWGDFATTLQLPPASQAYALLQAPASAAEPLAFALTGPLGVSVGMGSGAGLTVVRLR